MLITPAFAQAAGSASGSGGMGAFSLVIQFALIGLVFWFFILRPQSQRMKAHKAKIEAVKRGDQVVTGGGLVGKVTKVGDDGIIEIELAQGVKVRAIRSTLTDVVDPTSVPAAND